MSSELKDVADAIEEAENPQPSGPILLDSRGAPTRRPIGKKGDWLTRGQAEQMVMAERAENEKMVKWYMQQIPELVAKMLGDALAVNGLSMKPPSSETPAPEVCGAKSASGYCCDLSRGHEGDHSQFICEDVFAEGLPPLRRCVEWAQTPTDGAA